MKSITQEESLGCGIACVAKLVGLTYEATKNFFKKRKRGLSCLDIVKFLRKNKVYCKHYYIGNKKVRFENNDIVFIKRSKKYPNGHYLLKTGKYWMDSWINFCLDSNLADAKSGFRKKLPGKAIYLIRKV